MELYRKKQTGRKKRSTMKSTGRTLLAAACCLIVILLVGCAALSSLNTKQESLEERVKNYGSSPK
jgi:hypothetical protein